MKERGGRSDGKPLDYIADDSAAYQQAQYARIAAPVLNAPVESFEALMRQHAESRATKRMRTLDEHDAHLRQYGTGDADYMARRRYMQEHGLEYRDGPDGRRMLVWAPSTVYSESAYDAQRRAAQDSKYFSGAVLGSATGVMHNVAYDSAGSSRAAKDKAHRVTFTRTEILASLRAIEASNGGISEAIIAFENLE
jgi:hypothetical protein